MKSEVPRRAVGFLVVVLAWAGGAYGTTHYLQSYYFTGLSTR